MSSHLEALGFRIESRDDFEALAATTLEKGETAGAPRPGWRSVHWEPGGGPSLWVHESPRGAIECFSPALSAERTVRLFLAGWYDDAECEHCSGAIFQFRGGIDDAEPLFSFAAHLPEVALVRQGLPPGGSHLVRLGAIAERVELEEEGGAEGGIFLALGLAGPDGERPTIEPTVLVGARILAAESRTNPFSGLPWNWARVEARGLDLEVAVAESDAPDGLPVGGILRGTLRLSAFVEPTRSRERPSGWAQLYREGKE